MLNGRLSVPRRRRLWRNLVTICAAFAASTAAAQEIAGKDSSSDGVPSPSVATTFPAIADPGGIRSALAANGVKFQLNYIGESFGDVAGGMRQGAIYDGRLELVIDADLEKLWGLSGLTFHMNGYQIHGNGLTRYYVGNLVPVSNIEALASTRLYEAWFEQQLFAGTVALRVGQLGADTEFVLSKYAGLFVSGSYGWPANVASNLPSGGPAYPLTTPGVRLKYSPSEAFTFLLGLYNGDPAGPGLGDPQRRDPNGLNFRIEDPPLLMGEAQYSYNQDKDAGGLPGTFKFGFFRDFGLFADERFDATGISLANPTSHGVAAQHRGDFGVYGIIDQQIYRLPGADPDKGIGVFARLGAAPSDRNLIDFYADGGLTFGGLISARPDDAFGVAMSYSHISDRARALDRDYIDFSGQTNPIRDYELTTELTYQAQVVPGWTVQPDIQYIVRPGGHVANPRSPAGAAIRNALVIGVRTTINY